LRSIADPCCGTGKDVAGESESPPGNVQLELPGIGKQQVERPSADVPGENAFKMGQPYRREDLFVVLGHWQAAATLSRTIGHPAR
jgi:hypothetical protein